jgi:heme/copper-type cytochrome/quinol oxidase subunit 3
VDIPYTVEQRADTGLYNAQLGIWLFIASEVMLFGALFSGYALLRTGADGWPAGPQHLNVALGGVNTIVLIASSIAIALGVRALRRGDWARGRLQLAIACALGVVFLAVKALEYREHLTRGELPSTDNFFAVYYTLTGLHALHVIGGVVVLGYLIGPGASLWRRQPARWTHRAAGVSLYWQFVDVIWLLVFVTVYLV